ncbi:MAG: diadenylate cyclase CdaA [Verrucomicrobiales bacterium]
MFGKAGTFLETHWQDGIEILIIGILFYAGYRYFRRLRGARILVEFLVVLVVLTLIATILDLQVLSWLIRSLWLFGVIGLIVVFQPELRRAVVDLDRFNLFLGKKERGGFAEEMWEVCRQLSAKRFGALFAIQRGMDLDGYLETGVRIDAELSVELVMTIFHPKTMLHDGGVILKNGRIEGAACVFPVSQRELIDRSLGLRHRAAIGLTEQTDAIVIVVSEETGQMSFAYNGELLGNLSVDDFVSRLEALLSAEPEDAAESFPSSKKHE